MSESKENLLEPKQASPSAFESSLKSNDTEEKIDI